MVSLTSETRQGSPALHPGIPTHSTVPALDTLAPNLHVSLVSEAPESVPLTRDSSPWWLQGNTAYRIFAGAAKRLHDQVSLANTGLNKFQHVSAGLLGDFTMPTGHQEFKPPRGAQRYCLFSDDLTPEPVY